MREFLHVHEHGILLFFLKPLQNVRLLKIEANVLVKISHSHFSKCQNMVNREGLASWLSGEHNKGKVGLGSKSREDEDMKDQNHGGGMREKKGLGIGKHRHPAVPQ